MMTVDALGTDDAGGYYLEVVVSGVEDYYVVAGEVPGRWLGSAAPLLGMSGEVRREDLEQLLGGLDPRNGTRIATWRTNSAYDLTLSAPKSISLLWALGDPKVSATVRDAHDEAVDAAMAYMGTHACVVRRGHEGRLRFAGKGFVAAAFRHRTSREGDPQLHTHVVVANLTIGPDGEWSSLFGRALWGNARASGCVYQAVLRRRLGERLGVQFGQVVKGCADIAGIDAATRRAFSRRRVAIERAMAEHGGRSRRAAQVATLATRPAKPAPVGEDELRAGWSTRAAEVGLDVRIALGPVGPVRPSVATDAELAAILTEQHASFDRRRVVEAVASSSREGLLLGEIEDRVDRFLRGPEAVALATGRWSTPEMLAIEAEVLRLAPGTVAEHPGPAAVDAALSCRPSLSTEQEAAVRRICGPDRVSLVVGRAGAGKTFALDAARGAWQTASHDVVGCSLSARAARQMESSAGFASDTADRLLCDLDAGRRRLTVRSVVVVDEAGMLGSRRLARLVRHTVSAGAKLVLVGDPKQLPEIDPGGLFAILAETLGYAELKENRRQRHHVERAAAEDLRGGHVERMMLRLSRAGRLTTDTTADGIRDRMARDWHLATRAGSDTVMLAHHRSDVADLNRRARARLVSAGELSEVLVVAGDLELAVGDRVMTTRNNRRLGLVNGTVGRVAGAIGGGIVIEERDGKRHEVPLAYIAQGHVTHAYASTIHKYQGGTCDELLFLGDDTLYAEAGYTAITRGRERNQLYVVRGESGEGLDAVRRALERSGAKQTATEQRRVRRA